MESRVVKTRSKGANNVHGPGPSEFEGKDYLHLERHISLATEGRYACCGEFRESILLNMESATLDALFTEFHQSLQSETAGTQPQEEDDDEMHQDAESEPVATVSSPMLHLHSMVRFTAELFTSKLNASDVEAHVQDLVKKSGLKDAIKIESLLTQHPETGKFSAIGACRHAALIAGYLLVRLLQTENQQSKAKIFRFRTDLLVKPPQSLECKDYAPQKMPHAVIIYMTETGQRYLLDPTRKTPKNIGLVMRIPNKLTPALRKILLENYEKFNTGEFAKEIINNFSFSIMEAKEIASTSLAVNKI
ncbi:MAG: hypothetical protein P4M14_12595 [Gammaproteobacteria bacterium]|nr:hypothetical protein [Gammaproteobacteria bacterium]